MSVPAPAAPTHLLRLHSQPVNALAISDDNERLYSGDASGLVVVASTRSLRAIAKWQAHTDGLLGIEEWNDKIITHGRDNKLLVWTQVAEIPESARLGDTAAPVNLPSPTLCYSMDVNALNYCRFSLMQLKQSQEEKALVALPGLIDSSVADVWSLPDKQRVHAAIGQEVQKPIFSTDPKGRNSAGIIMSLHLFPTAVDGDKDELRLLCGYENGSVTLRRYTRQDKPVSVEGAGWESFWSVKLHAETVMAMRVSKDNGMAITVSADHLVGRYDLTTAIVSPESACIAYKTKHPGNGSVAIRDDGRVCAIGGWDGSIRLYSTASMKPLGTLRYHKASCQALEFAHSIFNKEAEAPGFINNDDEDEFTPEEKAERARWLIGGGKDSRISIWTLIDFAKNDKAT